MEAACDTAEQMFNPGDMITWRDSKGDYGHVVLLRPRSRTQGKKWDVWYFSMLYDENDTVVSYDEWVLRAWLKDTLPTIVTFVRNECDDAA